MPHIHFAIAPQFTHSRSRRHHFVIAITSHNKMKALKCHVNQVTHKKKKKKKEEQGTERTNAKQTIYAYSSYSIQPNAAVQKKIMK